MAKNTNSGQVYVLKLTEGKFYVGHTTRGMERVNDHFEQKGNESKWTSKYPPIDWPEGLVEISGPGKSLNDESKKTLEMMQRYGIENVRGGLWCDIKFGAFDLEKLTNLVKVYSPEKFTNVLRRPKRSRRFKRKYPKKN